MGESTDSIEQQQGVSQNVLQIAMPNHSAMHTFFKSIKLHVRLSTMRKLPPFNLLTGRYGYYHNEL